MSRCKKRWLMYGVSKRNSGRNNSGKITVRHRGGGFKKKLSFIDVYRRIFNGNAVIVGLHYDAKRSAQVMSVILKKKWFGFKYIVIGWFINWG